MLNKEQQEILAQRLKNSELRKQMFNDAIEASSSGNIEEYYAILNKMAELDGDVCEHGRLWCKPCLACDEIDAELHEMNGCPDPDYCDICHKDCDDEVCDGDCDICKDDK